MSPADDPAFVLATLDPFLTDERRARIEAVLAARLSGLTVAFEDLHDPHNGAAALRSIEAFGLLHVDVVEAAAPFRFSPTVTQGCDKWLSLARHPDVTACYAALRGRGLTVAAAVPGAATALDALDLARPTALVFGNEHRGLTGEARRAADVEFAIPLAGFTQSLNLSVAVAVSVYAAAAARRRALGAGSDLTDGERASLRARYARLSVASADAILRRARADRGAGC